MNNYCTYDIWYVVEMMETNAKRKNQYERRVCASSSGANALYHIVIHSIYITIIRQQMKKANQAQKNSWKKKSAPVQFMIKKIMIIIITNWSVVCQMCTYVKILSLSLYI